MPHPRRDIAPELGSLEETNAALRAVVALAEELQAASGKRVLWGTAQLFKHPRYAHGAATSAHRPSHHAAVFLHVEHTACGISCAHHIRLASGKSFGLGLDSRLFMHSRYAHGAATSARHGLQRCAAWQAGLPAPR